MTRALASPTPAAAPTASIRSPLTRTAQPSRIDSPSNTRAGLSTVTAGAVGAAGRCCAAVAAVIPRTSIAPVIRMRRIIVKGMMLTDRDRAMLDGDHGPAPQLAMSILVLMAAVYGATELMDISQAHID